MRVKTYLRRQREGSIPIKSSNDDIGVHEYPDVLLTMYINTLENGDSPRALREGIKEIMKRIQSPRVKFILQDIKRATSPVGRLHFYYGALERDLEEIRDISKESPQ
ncbi:hypothetical protein PJM42_0081 [Salmonella phage vB_SenP_UTK0001]|nr:hypothetical protein PJM42_0081 [Salmonella phage vB_SenP_UTK0001]